MTARRRFVRVGHAVSRGPVALVLSVTLLACGPTFDANPSEYYPKGGTDRCAPLGAPQAASRQGHVANWWECLVESGAWRELRVWDVFTGERVGGTKVGFDATTQPLLPAYDSDGWLAMTLTSPPPDEPSVDWPGLQLLTPEGVRWWSLRLPARATTSPSITKDDDIIVGDAAGQVHAWSRTGRPLWTVPLGGPALNRVAIARDGSFVTVIKRAERFELVAFEAGGLVRWRTPVDIATASPIITVDNRIVLVSYVGDAADSPADETKYRLRAYGPTDGALAWEVPLIGAAYGAVEGPTGTLYVAQVSGGLVRAHRPADGSVLWSTTVTPDGAQPTVLDNGWLVVGCGDGLCVLSSDSGALLGSMPAGPSGVVFGAFAQGGIISAPTVSGHYYVWNVSAPVSTAKGCWARLGADDAMSGRAP